jgi:hypothetical protein
MAKKAKIERLDVEVLEKALAGVNSKAADKKDFAHKYRRRREYLYGDVPETDVNNELEKEWQSLLAQRERLLALKRGSETNPVHLGYEQIHDLGVIETTQQYERFGYEFYVFRDVLYGVGGPYSDKEFKLLVRDEADRERRYFERLTRRHESSEAEPVATRRERVPERVRMAVWRRDQGRCARCGSREKLEYDHIIPVAEGGGNTERNIELLCERCNRAKGHKVS